VGAAMVLEEGQIWRNTHTRDPVIVISALETYVLVRYIDGHITSWKLEEFIHNHEIVKTVTQVLELFL
jgi:hypothetical protein